MAAEGIPERVRPHDSAIVETLQNAAVHITYGRTRAVLLAAIRVRQSYETLVEPLVREIFDLSRAEQEELDGIRTEEQKDRSTARASQEQS
jgi:hypothetical protein